MEHAKSDQGGTRKERRETGNHREAAGKTQRSGEEEARNMEGTGKSRDEAAEDREGPGKEAARMGEGRGRTAMKHGITWKGCWRTGREQ